MKVALNKDCNVLQRAYDIKSNNELFVVRDQSEGCHLWLPLCGLDAITATNTANSSQSRTALFLPFRYHQQLSEVCESIPNLKT